MTSIVQKIARSSYESNAQVVLRTTALSLVYYTPEYCAAVWLNRAQARKVGVHFHWAMKTLLVAPSCLQQGVEQFAKLKKSCLNQDS